MSLNGQCGCSVWVIQLFVTTWTGALQSLHPSGKKGVSFFFLFCLYLNSFSFLNEILIMSWTVFAANSCIKVLITNTLKRVLIWKWGGLRWCFPGGSEGKASVCLQCRRPGFNPLVGKIPWRRKWQPNPVLWPGEFHGHRSLAGYSS